LKRSDSNNREILMNPQRLVIVIRRFWPLTGPTETAACNLASALQRLGHRVDIVTVAWQKNWPHYFLFREFSVHRLAKPNMGPFGSFRYARALSRKLDDLNPDCVIMYGLGEELTTVRKTLGDDVPIVVRSDGRLLSERRSQKNFSLKPANQVVFDSTRTHELLLQRNTALPAITTILPDGVEFKDNVTRSVSAQSSARAAISDAHPILRIDSDQPLVITGSPMDSDLGLLDLVEAWKIVAEAYPQSRLWILGDGPKGRAVWEAIVDASLVYSIIMPGFFDDHTELFQAADLYVHPTRHATNCSCLWTAIANGLCSVVTEANIEKLPKLNSKNGNAKDDAFVSLNKELGLIAPTQNPKALGEAILMGIREKELRNTLGCAARTEFEKAVNVDRLAPRYLDVIDSNATGKPKVETLNSGTLESEY
jgi:glycosyltransferase involved in cell wall biosynthesis